MHGLDRKAEADEPARGVGDEGPKQAPLHLVLGSPRTRPAPGVRRSPPVRCSTGGRPSPPDPPFGIRFALCDSRRDRGAKPWRRGGTTVAPCRWSATSIRAPTTATSARRSG